MEKKRNELKGGTDMLGDNKKRVAQLELMVFTQESQIETLEAKMQEQEYKLDAHANALKTLLSMIEDLKAEIEKNSQIEDVKEIKQKQTNHECRIIAHMKALSECLRRVEVLEKQPIVEEKSDPSAKLRNKDGLLDSRVYFGKKQKEDEDE